MSLIVNVNVNVVGYLRAGNKEKKEKGMKVIGKIVKGDDYLLDIREYLGSEAGNDECDNLEIFET